MSVTGFPLLEDALLTGLVEQFPYEPREYPGLALFPSVPYNGDEITWDIVTGTRGMCKVVAMSAEAPIIARDGVRQGRATPMHLKEKMQLTNAEISLLRAAGDAPGTREGAERAVMRMLQKMRARQFERKNWAALQVLQSGVLTYSDPDSGLQFTVTYSFPTLTPPGTSWADPAATIVDDLFLALEEFADNAGYSADTLRFNPKAWREYFLGNTQWKSFITASPALSEAVLRGSTQPFQIAGMDIVWTPMRGQYVNDSGSLADRWDTSRMTLSAENGAPAGTFESPNLRNTENSFSGAPESRSWQDTGDSQQIWALVYDNGIPVVRDQNRVQTFRVVPA